MNNSINPRIVKNDLCRFCDTRSRQENTKNGYCSIALSALDEYPVRCIGEWSQDKIYWLLRYFDIFSKGMKNKWFNKINYIEICSGPGRCVIRDNGLEIDGTALSILNHSAFNYIQKAVFIDHNEEVVNALNSRIKNLDKSCKAKAYLGDYNNIAEIKKILRNLPSRCLNLIFLDPTDCSISFSLIKAINEVLISTDFIINIALYTDLNRNLMRAFLDPRYEIAREKYSRFLGSDDFFLKQKNKSLAEAGKLRDLRKHFLDNFKDNLVRLGFRYSDYPIPVRKYYTILFASKHPTGLDFWKKATQIGPDGQKILKLQ